MPQRVLQGRGPLQQVRGIDVAFDLNPPVGVANDDLVVVSVRLPPDFVMQPALLPFEKPDHASALSAAGCQSLVPHSPLSAIIGSTLAAHFPKFRCSEATKPVPCLTKPAAEPDSCS